MGWKAQNSLRLDFPILLPIPYLCWRPKMPTTPWSEFVGGRHRRRGKVAPAIWGYGSDEHR
jgi:hypothetical protein